MRQVSLGPHVLALEWPRRGVRVFVDGDFLMDVQDEGLGALLLSLREPRDVHEVPQPALELLREMGLVADGEATGLPMFARVDVGREGPLCHATAKLVDVTPFRVSGGVGFTADEARGRAVGEGLERFCAALAVRGASEPVPARALGGRALRVPLFSASQHARRDFPYEPFTDDTPLRWIEALDGILVPAALVALPYEPVAPEPWITPYLSHGLACGRTLDEAVTAGLCELVERHAFTTFWLTQRPAPTVRYSLPELERDDWDVTVYDLRHDVPLPTFLAVARSFAYPSFWLGAGAAEDPRRALTRALVELHQNHAWLQSAKPSPAAVPTTFEEHAAYHAKGGPSLPAKGDVDLADMSTPPDWRASVGAVHVVDLTTPEVARAGYTVVRVVAPSLVRLHPHHEHPFLGHPALDGVEGFPPHPFP